MIFPHPAQMCWICGKAVPAETRKIDVHGSTVHERCYAAKLARATEMLKLSTTPPQSASNPKGFDANRAQIQ